VEKKVVMRKKLYSLMIVLVITSAILALPNRSVAKTEIIYADHRTVMGDNDSKNDARQMCLLEAKRKVLEKAGTYIVSHTKVENLQLTKDEISTYSAALLKIDIYSEEWKIVGGNNMAVHIIVKAEVDTDDIRQHMSKIRKDVSLQKELKSQRKRLIKLEQKIASLQGELKSADQATALVLRKKKIKTLENISKVEEKYKYILKKRQSMLTERKTKLRSLLHDVLNYVDIGLKKEDAEYIIGGPNSLNTPEERTFYYYTDDQGYHNYFWGDFNDIMIKVGKNGYEETVVDSIYWTPIICKRSFLIKSLDYNILKDGIKTNDTDYHYCKPEIDEYIFH
jgi:hypothetical protein